MWKELRYALLGLPLAVAGFAYLLLVAPFSALSVIMLGLPVLATIVLGARGWGALHRNLARSALDVHWVAVRPPSSVSTCPVTNADASEQKKRIAPTRSSGSAIRHPYGGGPAWSAGSGPDSATRPAGGRWRTSSSSSRWAS